MEHLNISKKYSWNTILEHDEDSSGKYNWSKALVDKSTNWKNRTHWIALITCSSLSITFSKSSIKTGLRNDVKWGLKWTKRSPSGRTWRIKTRNQDTGQYQPYLWSADGWIKDSFEDIGISSGIIDRRQQYNYNKSEFEQQFNKWKNEKNNK